MSRWYRLGRLATLLFVVLGTIATSALAASTPQVTLALVSGAGASAPPAEVEPLLLAELGKRAGYRFVEREVISRAIEELKLGASGLTDPASALKLGQIAAADALILLERDGKSALMRVRVVEVRTGVRLLDWPCDVSSYAKNLAELVQQCAAAIAKLQIPDDDRKFVAVLGFVNEEMGDQLTPTSRALSSLVEHQLLLHGSVLLLERDQLQRLRQEETLTGVDLKLRASTVLVDGGIHRAPEPDKLLVTSRITFLASGHVVQEQISVPAKDLVEARAQIAARTLAVLKLQADPQTDVSIDREADDLCRRVLALDMKGQGAQGMSMAEAALALKPDDMTLRIAYRAYLAARYELVNKRKYLEHAQVTLRAEELGLERLRRSLALAPEQRTEPLYFSSIPNFHFPADQTRALEILRAARKVCLERYDLLHAAMLKEGRDLTPVVLERLKMVTEWSESAQEFMTTAMNLQREIDEQLRLHKTPLTLDSPLYAAYVSQVAELVELATVRVGYPGGRGWSGLELRDFLEPLTERDDPLFQIVGLCGLSIQVGEAGEAAVVSMLEKLLFVTDDRARALKPFHMLTRRAVGRHNESKRLAEAFDSALERIEAAKDPAPLTRWPQAIDLCLRLSNPKGDDKDTLGRDYCRRIIALLDASAVVPGRERQDAELRSAISIHARTIAKLDQVGPAAFPVGPWADYAIREIPLANVESDYKLSTVFVDDSPEAKQRDEELVLVWRYHPMSVPSKPATPNFTVCRLSVRGGTQREVGRFTGAFNASYRLFATGGNALYFATGYINPIDSGIVRIFEGRAERFDIAPDTRLDQILWLKDKLYLRYEKSLVQFDPACKSFELLASDKAIAPPAGLENSGWFRFYFAGADEQQGCLTMLVATANSATNGIYRYFPEKNRFVQVNNQFQAIDSAVWNNGKFYAPDRQSSDWWEIDFAATSLRRVKGYPPLREARTLANGNLHPDSLSTFFQFPHYVIVGQHLFGTQQQLLTPDGNEYQHASPLPLWWRMERCGDGFIAATKNTLSYIEPRRSKSSAGAAAQDVRRP